MTKTRLFFSLTIALAITYGVSPRAGAQDNAARYLFEDGKVWILKAGDSEPLKEKVELPNQILVNTNGTFKVNAHPPRQFAEGQILSADGMLLSLNGRIEPVIDHLVSKDGRMFLYVNGEEAPITEGVPFGNGAVLNPDGQVLEPDGKLKRVIEGQLFTPQGSAIPAMDTISLQNGKVVVQKEGTQLTVGSPTGIVDFPRSVTMNDGTKVFSDGTVLSRDGQVTHLNEGQIITIKGVVKQDVTLEGPVQMQ